MASIRSLTELISVESKSTFVSCSAADEESNCVIFTFQDHSQKFDVSNNRVVVNYKSKQSTEKFTSPVTYNHSTKEYVAVANLKVLKVYKDLQLKAQSFTTDTNIFKVEYVKELNKCYVLFHNGEVEHLDSILENPKVTDPYGDKSILQSFVVGTKLYFIAIGDEYPVLNFVDLTDDSSNCENFELNYPKELVSSCVTTSNKLVTLWSDGHLCVTDLPKNNDDIVMFKLIKEFKTNESFYSAYDYKVAAISSDVVAVLHQSENGQKMCMSVVDLVYKSVTKCNVQSINSKLDKDSQLVQVETGGGENKQVETNLFLVSANQVYLVDFKAASTVTLSSLLSLNKQENNQELADEPFYNKCSPKIRTLLNTLMSKSTTTNLESTWRELWKNLDKSKKPKMSNKPDKVDKPDKPDKVGKPDKTDKVDLNRLQLFYSKSIMSAMVENLFYHMTAEEVKSMAVLKIIIRTKLLSSRVVPFLLEKILKMTDKKMSDVLLYWYLKCVRNISEKDVVKSINHCVNLQDEDQDNTKMMLNKLISIKCTDTHLKYALTKLPYEKSVVVMKHVCEVLENSKFNNPNTNQALLWMKALIDVNLVNFMQHVETWAPILSNVQTLVTRVVHCNEEMKMLNKELQVLETRSNFREDNPKPSFTYSIDILDDEIDF